MPICHNHDMPSKYQSQPLQGFHLLWQIPGLRFFFHLDGRCLLQHLLIQFTRRFDNLLLECTGFYSPACHRLNTPFIILLLRHSRQKNTVNSIGLESWQWHIACWSAASRARLSIRGRTVSCYNMDIWSSLSHFSVNITSTTVSAIKASPIKNGAMIYVLVFIARRARLSIRGRTVSCYNMDIWSSLKISCRVFCLPYLQALVRALSECWICRWDLPCLHRWRLARRFILLVQLPSDWIHSTI